MEEPVLIAPAEALRDYPRISVDAETAQLVRYGRPLPEELFAEAGDGPWCVFDPVETLLAVYEIDPERRSATGVIKPAVVLDPA